MSIANQMENFWINTKKIVGEWYDKDPLIIIPYLSYSNEKLVIINGRVIENEGGEVDPNDSSWENFVNTIRSLETDEAKYIDVNLKFKGKEYSAKTDKEGYFRFEIEDPYKKTQDGAIEWGKATASLPEFMNEDDEPIHSQFQIMRPHSSSAVGVITDIDDTVLKSHVDSFLKLKLLYETFFKNAHTRVAFEGVEKTLESIVRNENNVQVNPIFYLSNSPWNLYNLLHIFLHQNDMPEGPIFLRDFGIKFREERRVFKNHKSLAIEHLLNFYDDLEFIFIGDATESDVDIYLEAYKKFPDRVRKIFIRATNDEEKNDYVRNINTSNPEIAIHLIHHSEEITQNL